MSIPQGKPFGAPDPSSHSQRDGERRPDDGELGRSPYAPKRVRGGFIAEPIRRVEEPVRTPEEPAGRAEEPTLPMDDDGAPTPKFLLSSRDAPGKERGLTDFPKSSLKFEDELNAAGIGRQQHSPETERRREPSAPAPTAPPPEAPRAEARGRDQAAPSREAALSREQVIDDEELRRLEESVRTLQREVSSGRGRAPEAPPPKADDASAQRRRADEAYINGFRVPRSLQPEILKRPPQGAAGRGRLQTLMAVLLAGMVAAPIAYYFSSGSGDPRPAPETVVAAAEPRAVETSRAIESVSVRTQRIDPAATRNSDPWPKSVAPSNNPWPQSVPVPQAPAAQAPAPQLPAAQSPAAQTPVPAMPAPQVAAPQEPAPQPEPPAVQAAAPQPSAPAVTVAPRRSAAEVAEAPPARAPVNQPQPAAPTRQLGQAEIDLLVKQGQQFVAAGDFVTARLVFQRAAEAGNAVAALALGASYDPGVLSSLGVRGIEADVSKARAWYQKAKEFGDPEASRRLDVLANRGGGR